MTAPNGSGPADPGRSDALAEVFPDTRMTLVLRGVVFGGDHLRGLRAHVSHVYAAPLKRWHRRSSWNAREGQRGDWDAETVVQELIAEKFLNRAFWTDYALRRRRLREHLATGWWFHVHERYRRQRRQPAAGAAFPEASWDVHPAQEAERQIVLGMMRLAALDTLAGLRREGRMPHRRLFVNVHRRGRPLDETAARLGVAYTSAQGMNRLVKLRFKAFLGDLLALDGADPDRLDDEIKKLLEVLARPAGGGADFLKDDPTREHGPDAGEHPQAGAAAPSTAAAPPDDFSLGLFELRSAGGWHTAFAWRPVVSSDLPPGGWTFPELPAAGRA